MTDLEKRHLRNTIHRILDDSAQPFINRAAFCPSGAAFHPEVLTLLQEWEHLGYLKILCDPDHVENREPIVEMLSYIGQKSSIPGFLNWQEP